MYCSKCGGTLAAGTAFCQSCGTPVGAPAPGGAVSPHASVGAIAYVTNVTYAGFWLRLVAHLLDGVIIGIAGMVVLIPLFLMMGGLAVIESFARRHGERPDPAAIAGFISLILVCVAVSVVIQWLYYAYLESGEKQATLGKQVLSLYVTDLSGHSVSFGRASGRFFAKMISGMIPLGIAYIMAGVTERKQALHDMIAGCLVLRR